MKQVLRQYYQFATATEQLKKLERFKGQYYWRDYPQPSHYESTADHSWRLALLVILLADELSQKINLEKALTMALIHDLPEIITGDASPQGSDGTGKNTYAFKKYLKYQKHSHEKKAAQTLFGKLPKKKRDDLYHLWLEYEQQDCLEAKVVKALDKIEALLQVLEYRDGHLFPEHLQFTLEYSLQNTDVDPAITQFGMFIGQELKKKYKKFEKP